MKTIFILIAISITNFQVHADEIIQDQQAHFPSRGIVFAVDDMSERIRNEDTHIEYVGRPVYATRMSVQVKKCVFSGGGRFRITINGNEHRYIHIKRVLGERTYFIPVERYVETLEFTNAMKNGCLKLKGFQLIRNRQAYPAGRGPWGEVPYGSDAYLEVNNISYQIEFLRDFASPSDRNLYLDPLTVAVGKALAILESSSELSRDAQLAVLEVISAVDRMEAYIDRLLRTHSTQLVAREIKSSTRRLKNMMDR